ncbi:hypothetical protein PAAG_06605 [Paracoccidioides lutzii Pb01]|uniref:C2H2-type domain-containing protein n=1 Tax=Paracoccidioides lutzii (strain ATCC MYA-826 / Pb01) TaxID=502779 RepID=C1H764_PARBA|nr:hypothetical protein PAAG_06605 [Paracoccidioides lutzii Pb01]EEH35558.2 hypothetical protein PAAG_06605 [Paracoccidioides lutzii Pb01]
MNTVLVVTWTSKMRKKLLAHKLESNRHIVCPVCGEEFKSDGGKNTHFAQFHPANQEMVCTFCSGKFNRAQAYMGHIENDQCTGFSAIRYKEQRAKKEAIRTIMSRILEPAERGLMIQATSNASSVDGGVQVSLSDSQEMTTSTEISSRKSIDTPGSECGTEAVTMQLRGMSLWPAPGEKHDVEMDPEERSLMTFSDMEHNRDKERPGRKYHHENNTGNLPIAPEPETSILGSINGSASEVSVKSWATWQSRSVTSNASGGREIGEKRKQEPWDANKFFSQAIGKWMCICDKLFDTEKDFNSHIKSGIHLAGTFRCPNCLRMFKSVTALTAHCESASVRCKINKDKNYAAIMDEISAGLIGADGENEDGSVRYRAISAEEAGIDLKKVD